MTPNVIADSIVNLCGAIGLCVAMVALHRRDPRSPLTRRLLVMLGIAAVHARYRVVDGKRLARPSLPDTGLSGAAWRPDRH
jgi:hypothetical protein